MSRELAPQPQEPGVLRILLVGALGGALGEYTLRTILGRWLPEIDRSFYLDPNALWMGPFANLPVYVVAIGLATGSARVSRARAPWLWGAWMAAFLAFVQSGLISRRISTVALLVLAAGLATVVARTIEPRHRGFARLLRPAMLTLLLVSFGGSALRWAFDTLRSSRALGVQSQSAASAPNVLLLILDTVRAASLGLYGNARPTSPTLDSLSRSGIRFDRAIAPAPWTLPSHAAIFTGRYPTELVWGAQRAFGQEDNTLAEHFTAAGYRTGGFVANTVYGSRRHGLDRGFQYYRDFARSGSQLLAASTLNQSLVRLWNRFRGDDIQLGAKEAAVINQEFLGWVRAVPQDRPWFAFLNYFDAHMPYAPPSPWDRKFLDHAPRRRTIHEQGPLAGVSAAEFRDFLALYEGAIAYLDARLGEVFRTLAIEGKLDNTIVVVTSDHGEAFGEHGFAEHGASVLLPEVQVPLIIRLPGNRLAGCTVPGTVSLRDLAATIADAARLGTSLPGYSLLPLCGPGGAARHRSPAVAHNGARTHLPPWYPASVGDMIGVYSDAWSYIRFATGREDLFDLRRDPLQQTSVVGDTAHRSAVDSLRAVADSLLKTAIPLHQWAPVGPRAPAP